MESNPVVETNQSLQSIEALGKTLLGGQLDVVASLTETVTLGGFMKALKLALVHEVAPELQKMELNEKQQFMAAHIAKAIDLVFNLKMTQLGQDMREQEQKAQSAEGETNGNNTN